MLQYARLTPAISCLLLVASCTTSSVDPTQMQITQNVNALEAIEFDRMCIEVNTAIKSTFTDDLFEAVKALGFATQSKQGAFGNECRHWLSYQAMWGGFPEYLTMADIKVFEDRRQLGRLQYDARKAGNRPDRYGAAMEKLRPLLEALLVRVER